MGYIYMITNIITNMSYIGQTINSLEERWKHHSYSNSNCRYLSNAIQKYGKENFKFKLICITFDDALDKLETDYIKRYNTNVPNGYNLREGGNGTRHHAETKIKISDSLKKYSKEIGTYRHSNGCIGKKLTDDHKAKISKAITGKKMSDDAKQKLSSTNKKYYVQQFSLDGKLLNTYDGIVHASKSIESTKSAISRACLGNVKTLKGFIWKYVTRDTVLV